MRDAACTNAACAYAAGFMTVDGQLVLIDFDNSIFQRSGYTEGGRGTADGRRLGVSLGARAEQVLFGDDPITAECCEIFLDIAKSATSRPTILVVGGGSRGAGAGALYADAEIDLIGSDVVATPDTCVVFDGHAIPFEDQSVDGVWIQAVLEHVLDAQAVVAEIHRVLKHGGVVFAATPFMQQVHLGAYDFSRFSMSGHRWLFRRFDEIAAGPLLGPGTALIWSVRSFFRALGWPRRVTNLIGLGLFFLRYADKTKRKALSADAASAFYFLGRKGNEALSPKDMLDYYAKARSWGSPKAQARAGGASSRVDHDRSSPCPIRPR